MAQSRFTCSKMLMFVAAWLLFGMLTGCQPEGGTAQPPLEQPQWASAVRRDVEQSLRHVQSALEQNRQDADAVETSLREAEKKLSRLATFDLVLQQASDGCLEAYRSAILGKKEDANRQLQEVEKILVGMAKGENVRVAAEFEETLKLLGDTRSALETMPDVPSEGFEDLLRRLHQMSLKGSIFLAGAS